MEWIDRIEAWWVAIAAVLGAVAYTVAKIRTIVENVDVLIKRLRSTTAYIEILLEAEPDRQVNVWLEGKNNPISEPVWLRGAETQSFPLQAGRKYTVGYSGRDVQGGRTVEPVVSGKPGSTTKWVLKPKEGTRPIQFTVFAFGQALEAAHDAASRAESFELETTSLDFGTQFAAAWARGSLPDIIVPENAALLRGIVALTSLFEVGTPNSREFVMINAAGIISLGCFAFEPMPHLLRQIRKKNTAVLSEAFGSEFDAHWQKTFADAQRLDRQEQLQFWRDQIGQEIASRQMWEGRFRRFVATDEFQEFQSKFIRDAYRTSVNLMREFGLRSQRALAIMVSSAPVTDLRIFRDKFKAVAAEQGIEDAPWGVDVEGKKLRILTGVAESRFPQLRPRLELFLRGKGSIAGFEVDLEEIGIGAEWHDMDLG